MQNLSNPMKQTPKAPFNPSNPEEYIKKIFRPPSKAFLCYELINTDSCKLNNECPSTHNIDEIFEYYQQESK